MKKQIKVSLTATAALLALAGIAQAAPAELNIYGSSAQYTYWNAQGQDYAHNVLGCTAAAALNNAGKHGFISAVGCTSTLVPVNTATGTRDLDIRYSGIASTEGILSVQKKAPLDPTLATGCNIANGERLMYASPSTLVCKQVHIGTSDVAAESLVQVSSGAKLGPAGGGTFSVDLVASKITSTGLSPNNTVVVPFGFYVNKSVTAQTCSAGLIGNYCTTNTQCDTAPGNSTGTCGAAATITNISREEAALLFSGQIANWQDLGAYFTKKPVTICLRHAGSGTHSALDLTVVNSSWGANVAIAEQPVVDATDGSQQPGIWFNQGTPDEVNCINTVDGAIGYADGDQAVASNMGQLKLNGFYPTRSAIRNGLYDFYTDAWLYTNSANGTAINAIANNLMAYAQDPAHVPASKANYWAAVGEMKYNRASDNTYPAFTGAANPMLP